ncbi:Uncharacterised protein [Salmonella enterica subsp. enterica serovar Bovismorbificans]|uniref:Uncharacterized protein n=1 Tax=Salmonella enterica subsp. enterica serovar Bovismorbificans TaxID=58097 RepID=A0A655DGB0_SALET|nr:Uncharacterised protein [Salmonella enterica subsp. enterica serovar Bovismorbificans]
MPVIQIPDGQVSELRALALMLLPPDLRRPGVISKERDVARLSTGFLNTALIRQPQLYPEIDAQMIVAQPGLRLIFRAEPASKLQPFISIFYPCQQAQHHALLRFRRVTRQRQCRIQKPVAIKVSHIDDGFINCRFKRHEKTPFESGAHCSENRAKRLLTNLLPTRVRR